MGSGRINCFLTIASSVNPAGSICMGESFPDCSGSSGFFMAAWVIFPNPVKSVEIFWGEVEGGYGAGEAPSVLLSDSTRQVTEVNPPPRKYTTWN